MAVAAPVIQAAMDGWIRHGGSNSGIVGNTAHKSGFHRAANEVPADDYSRRRDPNGSDGPFTNWNYACAGDFYHGGNERLRAMHREVLARLRRNDPGLSMICEFIGKPWADQPVMYWARWEGYQNLRKYTGVGHDTWSHISWYRSRANQPAPLWTPNGDDVDIWCNLNDKGAAVLRLQLRLRNLGFDLGKSGADSSYGPATAAALKKACLAVYDKYAGDGTAYEPDEDIYLDVLMARKYGKDAPNLQPLLDRLSKLEAALKALQTPTQPAPGTFPAGRLVVKGGSLEVEFSA